MKPTDRLKLIFLGILIGIGMIFLLGASNGSDKEIGRYQVSGPNNGGATIIIDTTTGSYQWVRPPTSL